MLRLTTATKHIRTIGIHVVLTLSNLLPVVPGMNSYRNWLVRRTPITLNEGANIGGRLSIRPDAAHLLSIGEHSYLNTEVRFGCQESEVNIGSNVLVGPRVAFETASHRLELNNRHRRLYFSQPIRIQDDVWIGASAIILGGVTIGRGAVVAAGAVVTHDVEDNWLVAGVPARKIRLIEHSDNMPPLVQQTSSENSSQRINSF